MAALASEEQPLASCSPQCRICLETGEALISPCRCVGSMAFVHEECLRVWLLSRSGEPVQAKCEICEHKYQVACTYSTHCARISLRKLPHLMIILLALMILAMLAFIIGILVSSLLNFASLQAKVLAGCLLVVSVVSAGTVVVLICMIVLRVCCLRKIVALRIATLAKSSLEQTEDLVAL